MSNLKDILMNKKICKSIWFMRQAGRYLPEFQKIRSKNQHFIKLCLNSELSSKITLQPIERFDLDSAIIFSDILMVPYALGQEVDFVKNQGPILEKFNPEKFLDNNKNIFTKKLDSVYKAIKITRDKLDKKKSLIAFAGAPWTLLVYMLGLKKDKKGIEFSKLKANTEEVNLVLNGLHDYLCTHIENQIEAGADVVQIFDSWAGLIPSEKLPNYCFKPNLKIANFCKEKKIPIICFPRGINKDYKEFNHIVKPHGLNLDYAVDPVWAKKNLNNVVLQGGMDPKTLLSSEEKIISSAKKYLDLFKNTPYIFNLGHGLLPETDPVKVSKLIKFYRNY